MTDIYFCPQCGATMYPRYASPAEEAEHIADRRFSHNTRLSYSPPLQTNELTYKMLNMLVDSLQPVAAPLACGLVMAGAGTGGAIMFSLAWGLPMHWAAGAGILTGISGGTLAIAWQLKQWQSTTATVAIATADDASDQDDDDSGAIIAATGNSGKFSFFTPPLIGRWQTKLMNWRELARYAFRNPNALSESAVSSSTSLSANHYAAMRGWMLDHDYAELKNPRNPKDGVKLTESGMRLFSKILKGERK